MLSCFNGYSESFHWTRKPKLPKLPASLRSLYSPGNCELTDGEAQPISNIMFNKDTSVQSSKLKARRQIMVVPTASHKVQDQLKMQVFSQWCSVVVMDTQNHSIVCLFDLILYVHSTIFQLCGTVLPGFNQY